jgi:hypothetical protein
MPRNLRETGRGTIKSERKEEKIKTFKERKNINVNKR